MPSLRIKVLRPAQTIVSVPDYGYATWGGSGLPSDPGVSADRSGDLETWLNAQASGTAGAPVTILFPFRRVFHIQNQMLISNKSHWIVDYNECWFVRDEETYGDESYVPSVNKVPGWEDNIGPADPAWTNYVGETFFDWFGGSHQTHKNGYVRGSNRTDKPTDEVIADTTGWGRPWTEHTEGNHAWRWGDVHGLTITNLHAKQTWGDGFTLGGEGFSDIVEYVLMTNSTADVAGRQAVTIGSCYDVLVDNVNVTHGWAVAYDTEVNGAYEGTITDMTGVIRQVRGSTNVEVRNCSAQVRTGMLSSGSRGLKDVYFHDNTFWSNPSQWRFNINNGPVSGIRIENNTAENACEAGFVALTNATGTNIIKNNVAGAEFNNLAAAIYLGEVDKPTSGTLIVQGNDFGQGPFAFDGLYDDVNVVSLTKTDCGNRTVVGGSFDQPVVC